VQCSAVQCSAVQCSAVQCSAVQCSAVTGTWTVQCSAVTGTRTVQCSAVQCSAVQCSAVTGTGGGAAICGRAAPAASWPPPRRPLPAGRARGVALDAVLDVALDAATRPGNSEAKLVGFAYLRIGKNTNIPTKFDINYDQCANQSNKVSVTH
jgi:hypothetical protein